MSAGLFVTGTDTGCGKTRVAVELIRGLRGLGLRVAGFKPVAAGAERHDGILRNDDALALAAASGIALPDRQVNPYCFAEPIAPHLAAGDAGVEIRVESIVRAFRELCRDNDLVIVEGAGGWAVPLAPRLDMADLARVLEIPVVLVIGLRLGCLNHARLSEQAIRASGVPLAGWIGSQVDPDMRRVDDNLTSLDLLLASPCLGVMPNPHAPPLRSGRPLNVAQMRAAAGA
ncbi:MAG: dethiobiotin synthase [Chromatiaceae bacterium]|nr:dethiobiotin synthase [Gammaproteobacteria bacterium]MCP5300138.1 dethiobiotin synthase [Chromatiaceae bacterium]MCP5422210.1 dethiobiotin synthase [Chromatiaceae bacterium]